MALNEYTDTTPRGPDHAHAIRTAIQLIKSYGALLAAVNDPDRPTRYIEVRYGGHKGLADLVAEYEIDVEFNRMHVVPYVALTFRDEAEMIRFALVADGYRFVELEP